MSDRSGWLELGTHEALTMGSDLWLISDLSRSAWARKIDWYLNFQLSRAAHHARREISTELASTAESWEFDPPVIESRATAPLLVASSKFLPNKMTVQVAGQGAAWVKAAAATVASLRSRSIRLFLPTDLSLQEFSKAWGGLDTDSGHRFTVVLDHGTRSN